MGSDLGFENAFRNEIPGQGMRFVGTDVLRIKPLSVQIRCLYFVVVQYSQSTNSFATKRWSNMADQSTGPDAQDVARRKGFLNESGYLALPILCTDNPFSLKPKRCR